MQLLNPGLKYVHVSVDYKQDIQIEKFDGTRDCLPGVLIDRDQQANDHVFYIEFKDGDAFKNQLIHDLVPMHIMQQIKDPTDPACLLMNNSHEAFHRVVDEIYQYVIIDSDIPAEKVILISGSFDILDCIDQAAIKHELPPIRAELTMDFERGAAQHLQNWRDHNDNTHPIPVTLMLKPYEKKYINLNRRWRGFRPMFVSSLMCTGLLEQGFVSLAPSDDGHKFPDYWHDLWNMSYEIPWFRDLIGPNKDRIENMPPLYLDTTEMMTNWAQAEQPGQMNEYYENTYFSVVSETNFFSSKVGFEPSRFFSEKTFKAIIHHHPILFLSTPGMVSALKQIGYKSYAPWIDESYDQIEDDGDRMLAVLKETERLCNLSGQDLEDFLIGCQEIVDYNFNVLRNKTNFWYKLYDN